ncbi:hypothetical protein NITHO_310008 [Nitrolancea hollandica Lb]|uniref:Uncharacterized protein n=1 Tax=Nitrolancea hollandica Lb TaxID=1129897 RepID=I4EHF3_9BACT|nr:hypothetical protein NITHO_310008 [Nitrolancea hollandica Lb]
MARRYQLPRGGTCRAGPMPCDSVAGSMQYPIGKPIGYLGSGFLAVSLGTNSGGDGTRAR